jgi:negative regulator of sigma E activity
MGSANAYSTSVRGHVITAIGEVPAATVREIANSVAPVQDVPPPAANGQPGGPAR